jgi:DNA-binding transcriptional regulator YhcF (GntR family)
MDIVLNRRAGLSFPEQIAAQIDLKILSGELTPGARLPSVRALARRLKVHSNTVSAAYRRLGEQARLELRRGSGVFVRRRGPRDLREAKDLDEMIRLGLQVALERYSGVEVRAAVLRWLSGMLPTRIVTIDPAREMAELLARELSDALKIPATACSLIELKRHPKRLSGSLGVALPYHLEAARRLVPSASIEGVALELPPKDRQVILGLPAGAIVLLVSHSADVLRLGSVFLRSLRGDELLVEAQLVRARRQWKRLLSVADWIFADAIAHSEVARARSRRVREVRFLPESSLERLRSALSVVVPDSRNRRPPRRKRSLPRRRSAL